MSTYLTRTQLEEVSGVPFSTLKHWINSGLLSFIAIRGDKRTGWRRFPKAETLKRIKRIKALQAKGYSVEMMRKEF